MEKNFLFIDHEKLDTAIYRIFPIHRFLEILDANKLALVGPRLWDDPFENALLSSTFIMSGEETSVETRNPVHGQCWAWHRESNTMWRICSPSKDGIKVSTTPKKLLTALHEEIGSFVKVRGFLGQVQYATSKDLINRFRKIELLKIDGSGIAESLLYKQKTFQHENKVRLIYFGQDGLCKENISKSNIRPTELLDGLLFDPRINPYPRKEYKGQIIKTGEFKFKRSKLYGPPENFKFNL